MRRRLWRQIDMTRIFKHQIQRDGSRERTPLLSASLGLLRLLVFFLNVSLFAPLFPCFVVEESLRSALHVPVNHRHAKRVSQWPLQEHRSSNAPVRFSRAFSSSQKSLCESLRCAKGYSHGPPFLQNRCCSPIAFAE